jgi:polysaccharide biosynthesis/export protein
MSVWWRTCLLFGLLLTSSAPSADARQTAGAVARESVAPVHVIRPGDLLRIRVWPDTLLGGEFQVEDTGLLHLPGLGEVTAAGRTLQQLREELRLSYGETYSRPVITVTPIVEVSVLGAVVRPDVYVVRPTETVLDALSRAGGLRPEANDARIIVMRYGEAPQVGSMVEGMAGEGVLTTRIRSGDRIIVEERRRINFQSIVLALQSAVLLGTLILR